MTQDEILKCKELMHEFNVLVEKYYNEYLKNLDETYSDWKWSSENPDAIIIVYGFWNYYDEWDYNESYVTIEELSNFKPNNY